ncbi:redox-sensitive transcriptional activator SoxR [Sinorhizobium garamanticum]|uniref:Redox-sensitive transcriptional activator SoxR n=1 Tax=Sinorhizobium garamanticum TaxID=680247 RepID=A0ABY8DK19_9HYPH|nr:redox-sensitive transcriptional activator SoxR [Sinorhizobium garamanticum]WEX91264.1 redox-sensitive transcriptional activator SoxR [Sinorhizobium garamanticum]
MVASERAGSGHRRYHRSVLRRITFIVFVQDIGLTLGRIGTEVAKLPADRVPSRRDWSRASGQSVDELQRLRSGLTECIGCGCLSIERCSLANPADAAGRKGRRPQAFPARQAVRSRAMSSATRQLL